MIRSTVGKLLLIHMEACTSRRGAFSARIDEVDVPRLNAAGMWPRIVARDGEKCEISVSLCHRKWPSLGSIMVDTFVLGKWMKKRLWRIRQLFDLRPAGIIQELNPTGQSTSRQCLGHFGGGYGSSLEKLTR